MTLMSEKGYQTVEGINCGRNICFGLALVSSFQQALITNAADVQKIIYNNCQRSQRKFHSPIRKKG